MRPKVRFTPAPGVKPTLKTTSDNIPKKVHEDFVNHTF